MYVIHTPVWNLYAPVSAYSESALLPMSVHGYILDSVSVWNQAVGPNPEGSHLCDLDPSLCKQAEASGPNLLWIQSFCSPICSQLWLKWLKAPPGNHSCTQSRNSSKTSRSTSLPHVRSQYKKKQFVNRSVIQHQLSTSSTRYQSLVLCW